MRSNGVKQAVTAATSSSLAAAKERRALTSAAAVLKELFSPAAKGNVSHPSPEAPREGGRSNRTGSESTGEVKVESILSASWFSNASPSVSRQKKEMRKERKAKWVIKNTQTRRFDRLVRLCAQKLGTESTLEILGKLGRETGIKECNSIIKLYLDQVKSSKNEEESLIHIQKIFDLFKFINEEGLQFEKETCHSVFMYLIEMKMTQEFQLFIDLVRRGNSTSATGLDYYEMLLYLKINDKKKINDLFSQIIVSSDEDGYGSAENYLLAFCDTDNKEEIRQFLDKFGIRKPSSFEHTIRIINSFGRLSLEMCMEDFALALRKGAMPEEDISSIICAFVVCLPNLSVDDTVSKFSFLHKKLEVIPSAGSYEKLIEFFCKAAMVNAAINTVKKMLCSTLVPSSRTFDIILSTIELNGEFEMVHTVYSIMRKINMVPEDATIKTLVNLFTRMEDFISAHKVFEDLKEMKKMATASMYNVLLAAYFRKGNLDGALMVVQLMENDAVQRDAETFSYLIVNSLCEEHIVQYCDEMKHCGIKATRQVFMALVNAFANVGRFEKAKQILLDETIPPKHLSEIKSVLISALAVNGEVSSALEVFSEMKQSGYSPQAKAVCTLIEYIRSEGKIEILLQLLEELRGSKYWFDAASRVVLYCLRHNILSPAVKLLKQMLEVDDSEVYRFIDQAFSQLCDNEPTNLEFGLQLLQNVKELGLHPSRASLDFLLSCCLKVRDPQTARFIWSQYRKFHLPHNMLTFLRMYQVLLASGEFSEAKRLLKKVEKHDPHVCLVLKACDDTYQPLQR